MIQGVEEPDVDDPFLRLTEDSLNFQDGNITRGRKNKLGYMFPVKIGTWGFNMDKFFVFTFNLMVLAAIAVVAAQYAFGVSKMFLATTVFVNLFQLVAYVCIFVSDPGIAFQSVKQEGDSNSKFCHQCEIFVDNSTQHCQLCDVCIIGMDHHCPWTSKCVGKKNMTRFIVFVTSTFIFILYDVVALPLTIADDDVFN